MKTKRYDVDPLAGVSRVRADGARVDEDAHRGVLKYSWARASSPQHAENG
jgi:hypothetical protein